MPLNISGLTGKASCTRKGEPDYAVRTGPTAVYSLCVQGRSRDQGNYNLVQCVSPERAGMNPSGGRGRCGWSRLLCACRDEPVDPAFVAWLSQSPLRAQG